MKRLAGKVGGNRWYSLGVAGGRWAASPASPASPASLALGPIGFDLLAVFIYIYMYIYTGLGFV